MVKGRDSSNTLRGGLFPVSFQWLLTDKAEGRMHQTVNKRVLYSFIRLNASDPLLICQQASKTTATGNLFLSKFVNQVPECHFSCCRCVTLLVILKCINYAELFVLFANNCDVYVITYYATPLLLLLHVVCWWHWCIWTGLDRCIMLHSCVKLPA